MCGISGYVGSAGAIEAAVSTLKRLEYRGYDSAGVAFHTGGSIHITRATGKVAALEGEFASGFPAATAAIAHTRWATHGRPTTPNAHPHVDCRGRIAIVHNGIIENHEALRRELTAQGHAFQSETDTEVIAHLLEREMADWLSCPPADDEALLHTFQRALACLRGAYAVGALLRAIPGAILVARSASPLVAGISTAEAFVASDIAALLHLTRKITILQDGDVALVRPGAILVLDAGGQRVERPETHIAWDAGMAEKGGHDHFMHKEIHEGPETVQRATACRILPDGRARLPEIEELLKDGWWPQRISLVGCGTAYHAALVGKRMLEQALRIPVEATPASEFRYGDPVVGSETLAILVSQSGETADTLAALEEASSRGARTAAIVNVMGSSLARLAQATLYTQAGPEISVASTKAYLAQVTVLALLTAALAQASPEALALGQEELIGGLQRLPAALCSTLDGEREIAQVARRLAAYQHFFFLGRGYDYAAAMEAALKLKEITYLHAEAYAAGEMKHGPLALVDAGVAVIGLSTQAATAGKMESNLREVQAREGHIVALVSEDVPAPSSASCVLRVPAVHRGLMPIVAMPPLQLLAYYVARELNREIDQPRNLAKSVTVE